MPQENSLAMAPLFLNDIRMTEIDRKMDMKKLT